MGTKTKIEWTESTWNPIRGCSVVSEGCRNCYAMQVAARFSGEGQAYEGLAYRNTSGAHWTGKVRLIEEHLEDPLRWKRPRRIFVNSMSDLFHEDIADETIQTVFSVMAQARQHTFQILTKRPERMRAILSRWQRDGLTLREGRGGVLPNVWLGVSVEDQKTADERIPLLLETPAAVRWISAEPLLGPVDLSRWLEPTGFQCLDPDCVHWQRSFLSETEQEEYELTEDRQNAKGDTESGDPICLDCGLVGTWTGYDHGLDWVVVGGESGPGARPMHPDWVRSIRDQCKAAGVPLFFKQWGALLPGEIVKNGDDVINGTAVYDQDGERLLPDCCGNDYDVDDTQTAIRFRRVGKKAAGHTLDGREHREYPA